VNTRVLAEGSVRIEVLDGYVKVWHSRPADDVAELELILGGIDDALKEQGLDRVMFDSRESEYRGGDVQTRMWEWLSHHPVLKRVATLVTSELLATSVNMTGVSKSVKIKAFADEVKAVSWLVGG
jgi:hypothetical protein